MSVDSFDPQRITVTEAARAHLHAQLEGSGRRALRLGIKESGCNGYAYTLDYIDGPAADDQPALNDDTLPLYVSRGDLPLVGGTEVDFVREGLNASLRLRNPNAESHCGCGESFSMRATG